MTVHLVNPSHVSFGIGVITPRWLYVLASATPPLYGTPTLVDETLESLDPSSIRRGDVVGIGIHTGNALRGYEVGTAARAAGAYVVYGGIHATLYPDEALQLGYAHAVVSGDGDHIWPVVLADCARAMPKPRYDGGRIEAADFLAGRWDLLPERRYMWASVQTVRGCPKHCSFCSVWRTDGQRARQRATGNVVEEILELRRRGFRFIALADDNFYPVTLNDLRMAARRSDPSHLAQLQAARAERFALMEQLARLPDDTVFFTQITMEAAEDPEFLSAMRRAHIKGALVGVESVTPEGLNDVYKEFNESGDALVERLRAFRRHGVHVLGSFIFGLPSDRPHTFDAVLAVAKRADLTFAQFVMLTPFPGTIDFAAWERSMGKDPPRIRGVPVTRHWLIPQSDRPKVYMEHAVMSADEIRHRTQLVWDRFYSVSAIWARSRVVRSLKARVAFLLISKVYRQMYANTGIATDSARVSRSARWARGWPGLAAVCSLGGRWPICGFGDRQRREGAGAVSHRTHGSVYRTGGSMQRWSSPAHWGRVALLAVAASLGLACAPEPAANPDVSNPDAGTPNAVTLADFRKRADEYIALQKKLSDTVGPLDETRSPTEISQRERALGQAIVAARAAAKRGDIFTPAAGALFQTIVREEFAHRSRLALEDRDEAQDELPNFTPAVNQIYPTTYPLATFPPGVLTHLPALPEPLEYRFVQRNLILRDIQANLIVDVLPDAAPTMNSLTPPRADR